MQTLGGIERNIPFTLLSYSGRRHNQIDTPQIRGNGGKIKASKQLREHERVPVHGGQRKWEKLHEMAIRN